MDSARHDCAAVSAMRPMECSSTVRRNTSSFLAKNSSVRTGPSCAAICSVHGVAGGVHDGGLHGAWTRGLHGVLHGGVHGSVHGGAGVGSMAAPAVSMAASAESMTAGFMVLGRGGLGRRLGIMGTRGRGFSRKL